MNWVFLTRKPWLGSQFTNQVAFLSSFQQSTRLPQVQILATKDEYSLFKIISSYALLQAKLCIKARACQIFVFLTFLIFMLVSFHISNCHI